MTSLRKEDRGASRLAIVMYAVNGSGAGHLTRLVAISRWLRRYAAWLGRRAEIYFLTSSEAGGLLFHERFAAFKLPSKTAVGEAGIDKTTYLALAKQWVWHSLGLLRPDLLVVDTFPRGAFGELLLSLDLCQRKAFVHRPVKDSFGSRPDFQAMLPLYDLILVPEHEQHAPCQVPKEARRRLLYTGPIVSRERVELLGRDEARRRLGIAPGTLLVYVSAGGGGDPGAEAQLHGVCRALRSGPLGDPMHLLIGAGPLYRGLPLYGPGVTMLTTPGMADYLPACDLAVCAAGYNTFYELMQAGVPAVFLPQEKVADEQDARAARAARTGAARVLPKGAQAAEILAAARELLGERSRAAAAALGLLPRNCARDAAAALLRLLVPAAEIDAAQEAVTDGLLLASRDTGAPLEALVEVLQALGGPGPGGAVATEAGFGDGEEEDLEAEEEVAQVPAGDAPPPSPGTSTAGAAAGSPADAAAALLRQAHERGVPVSVLSRLVRQVAPKLPAGAAVRAEALALLIGRLAPFQDWPGALLLLKMLSPEADRGRSAAQLAALGEYLAALAGRGEDLYRGLSHLAVAQEQAAGDNQALLAAALGRLS